MAIAEFVTRARRRHVCSTCNYVGGLEAVIHELLNRLPECVPSTAGGSCVGFPQIRGEIILASIPEVVKKLGNTKEARWGLTVVSLFSGGILMEKKGGRHLALTLSKTWCSQALQDSTPPMSLGQYIRCLDPVLWTSSNRQNLSDQGKPWLGEKLIPKDG